MNLETERMETGDGAFYSGFYINYLQGLDFLCEKYVRKSTRILELGSYKGISSELFTRHSDFVTVVDIAIHENLKKIAAVYDLKVYQQSSLEFLADAEKGAYDMIYLDTTHEYEYTKSEIALSCQKLNPGQYLAGHDYLSEGVHRAILDTFNYPKIEIFLDSSWIIRM